jgi:hypothetical protein
MQLGSKDPLFWVLGSLALAVIATNVTRLAMRTRWWGRAASSGDTWGRLRPLVWLLTALFLFLPPIAAWRDGALSPYLMGLSELDWVDTLVTSGGLAVVCGGIIVFGWLIYRHKLPVRPRARLSGQPWLAPVNAALLQWHWAFYRAGVIGWLVLAAERKSTGSAAFLAPFVEQPLYWGSWLGMILVAVEWGLNPFAREALIGSRHSADHAPAAELTVIRMALAVSTTALFVVTRNFWLALVCHVVVETAIVAFLPARDQ